MKLIIAEKPSLARNIASAVGNMKKSGNCFEGGGYIITWVFGHLFSLADIETYSPNPDGTVRWTMKNLPCFPEKFDFELRKGADKKTDSEFGNVRLLSEVTSTDIPEPIKMLENAEVRFKEICDRDKMLDAVYEALKIK